MITEAQKRATRKYIKKNIRQYVVKLNKTTDEELVTYLESLDNIQGEIKKVMNDEIGTNGIRIYLRDVGTDKYEVSFHSNKFWEAYIENKDTFDEDDYEIYFINRNELSEELNKIMEYLNTSKLNITYIK